MGFFNNYSCDDHEVTETAHNNWFGSPAIEVTITERDGSTSSGWGWTPDAAGSNAQAEHDRNR